MTKYIIDIDSLINCLDFVSEGTINNQPFVYIKNVKNFVENFPKEKVGETITIKKVNPNYIPPASVKNVYAEWKMVLDDFDDGAGNRELPHCTNCHKGVYKHDAGSWCPFCGSAMKNPMR